MASSENGPSPFEQVAGWIAEARLGSADAAGRLFEYCRSYLLLIANEELGEQLQARAGASDLVQQTFLEAQQGFRRFAGQSEAELLAWLGRILRNNIANLARNHVHRAKRSVGREVALEELRQAGVEPGTPSRRLSPSHQAMAQEDTAALEKALQELPADYQQVIHLRHQEHKSFAEIGVALKRSAEAARKLWSRAIEQLQQKLQPPHEPT